MSSYHLASISVSLCYVATRCFKCPGICFFDNALKKTVHRLMAHMSTYANVWLPKLDSLSFTLKLSWACHVNSFSGQKTAEESSVNSICKVFRAWSCFLISSGPPSIMAWLWLQNWQTVPLNCTDDKGLLPLSLIIRVAGCQWDTQRETVSLLHPSSHCPIAWDLLQEAISQLSHLLGAFGCHGKLQKASIGHFNWQLRTTEALAWNQTRGAFVPSQWKCGGQ